MTEHTRSASIVALIIVFGSIAAFAQTDNSAAEALNSGVAAFKAGRYSDAIENFKKAVAIDPNNTTATSYLGTTYAYQVVPNLNTPENLAIADNAIVTLKQVPKTNPE